MPFRRTLLVALVAPLALAAAATSTAQIPALLNYQVMLTDDAGQPLVDQEVDLVFRIYDAESGGAALWSEAQSPTTNSIGVVSIILGDATETKTLLEANLNDAALLALTIPDEDAVLKECRPRGRGPLSTGIGRIEPSAPRTPHEGFRCLETTDSLPIFVLPVTVS